MQEGSIVVYRNNRWIVRSAITGIHSIAIELLINLHLGAHCCIPIIADIKDCVLVANNYKVKSKKNENFTRAV